MTNIDFSLAVTILLMSANVTQEAKFQSVKINTLTIQNKVIMGQREYYAKRREILVIRREQIV